MMHEPIVFVVDDDPDVRQSLQWLLESVHLRTKTCASAHEFLDSYDPDVPSCVLLDVRMPGMSGLDLQARLAADGIEVPVIMITGHADVPMAVRSLKLGAFDFIEKPFNDQIIVERVQKGVSKDSERCHNRKVTSDVQVRFSVLTAREREVMERVVSGESNKEVAAALGLSPKTVEVHRAHVMEKVGAQSLAELVRLHVTAQIAT